MTGIPRTHSIRDDERVGLFRRSVLADEPRRTAVAGRAEMVSFRPSRGRFARIGRVSRPGY
jgi:hypothetical protein